MGKNVDASIFMTVAGDMGYLPRNKDTKKRRIGTMTKNAVTENLTVNVSLLSFFGRYVIIFIFYFFTDLE